MSRTFQIAQGDWVVTRSTGRPATVTGRAKLSQDLFENLAIETQPNGFGAGLDDLRDQDLDPEGFRMEAQFAIQEAITAMQRLQDEVGPGASGTGVPRPGNERIASISSLTVTGANFGGGTTKTGHIFKLRVRPVEGENLGLSGSLT